MNCFSHLVRLEVVELGSLSKLLDSRDKLFNVAFQWELLCHLAFSIRSVWALAGQVFNRNVLVRIEASVGSLMHLKSLLILK